MDGNGSSTPIVWGNQVFLLTAINTGRIDPSLPKPEDQPKRVFGIKYPNTTFRFVVLCLDRNTGKVLWRQVATEKIPHEGHHGDNDFASASPTTDGERLYCMSGYEGYCVLALPLSATGDISKSEKVLWSKDRGTPYVPSPVLYDGMLYFNQSNTGIVSCLDAKTGDAILDRTRLPGISNLYASPVGANGRVYFTARDGTTLVLERSSELNVVATNELDDQFDSSAALAGNQLFLRGAKFLYCIAEDEQKQASFGSQGKALQSDPIFSASPIWSSGTSTSGGDGIARFIDADGDSDLDFLTCAPNPKRWVLYRNEAGKLASKPYWESAETTDCDHIDVLDFNKDGLLDLAATHESHCTLYFNKSGTFGTRPDWETGITTDANQISFGDFDRDGDLDLLMASGKSVNGVALFDTKNGTPSKTVSRKIGYDEYSETAIFGDYDGDGDLDIFASYGRSGRIVVYRNNNGEFDSGTVVYQDSKQPWTQRLYWKDLDGNGEPELFCAGGPWGAAGASVQLVKQSDATTMKVIWRSARESAIHGFDFGDVDLDGDLDMVAADWGGGGMRGITVYLSEQGRLTKSPAWSAKTSKPAHEVMLADIDGDGDLDLAVGCQDQAHVFENVAR